MFAPVLSSLLDILGTFAFGLSGAMVAIRRRLDLFGILVLSAATGVAGGIIRDLLIGDVPPAAVRDVWPLIVTNSVEMYTLPVGLSGFGDEADVAWELIMTGAAISTIPTLIVFLIFQRFIIRGVVMAGLKG